jgi:hypothetical protein
MRNGLLGTIASLLAGAGLAWAQPAHMASSLSVPAEPAAQPGTMPKATDSEPTTTSSSDTSRVFAGQEDWANFQTEDQTCRFRVNVDLMAWFTKNARQLPPLVEGNAGATGESDLEGTSGASIDYHLLSGFRVSGAYTWDQCPDFAIDGNVLVFGKRTLAAIPDSNNLLERPFGIANEGFDGSLPINFPGVAAGAALITSSEEMWGMELNLDYNLINEPVVSALRLDVFGGFRFFELSEDVRVASVTNFNFFSPFVPDFLKGDQLRVFDSFLARNQFFGPQLGITARWFGYYGIAEFSAKLGLGTNHETIHIVGAQVRVPLGGQEILSPGGLLALPSNSGSFTKDQFAVLPEINGNWIIPVTDNLKFKFGYTFLYWDTVVRPADQIDRIVNISQIPNVGAVGFPLTIRRPSVPFLQSHFYAQGFNVGLEFSW